MCDQWRYWWDCTYVQACLNLHCSNLVDLEMYVFVWRCYFLCVSSEGIDETVHLCRSEPPLLDYHVIISQSFCSCSLLFVNWFEPWHEISNNVVCATSKGSDQPAHTRRLIRAFTCRSNILWVLSYWLTLFEVSKPKRGLHRLVWVYTCQNATLFEITCRGSINDLHHGILYTLN